MPFAPQDKYYTSQGYASPQALKSHKEYDMIAIQGGKCRLHIVHPLPATFPWDDFYADDLEEINEHLNYVIEDRKGGATFQAAVKKTKTSFDAFPFKDSIATTTTSSISSTTDTDTSTSSDRTIRGTKFRPSQLVVNKTPSARRVTTTAPGRPVFRDDSSTDARIEAWQDNVPGGYRPPSVASSRSLQSGSFYTASEGTPSVPSTTS